MVVLLAGPGLAQPPQLGGPGSSDPAALLRREDVQKELKLDKDQTEKIRQAMGRAQERYKDDLAKLAEITPEAQRMKRIEHLRKVIAEESLKAAGEFLRPQQFRRLKQIDLQNQGIRAFEDPQVQKALQLSEDQKGRIQRLSDDAAVKMRDLFRAGDFKGTREKLVALRKEPMEKAQAVLGEDQKKVWKELTGEPFEVRSGLPPPEGKERKPAETPRPE